MAAVLAGFVVPLTLADKLLGRFAPHASARVEAAWMTRILVTWQVAWLAAGLGWLGQRPAPLVASLRDGGGRLVRQVQRWTDGSEASPDPAPEVPRLEDEPEEAPPGSTEILVDPPAPTPPAPEPASPRRPAPEPDPEPAPRRRPAPDPEPDPEPAPPPEPVVLTPRPPARPPAPAPRRRPRGFWPVDDGLTPLPAGAEKPRRWHGKIPTEVAEIARELTRGARGEQAKLVALHDWVARNITYDVNMLLSGVPRNQDPVDVLRRRMAVCEGYSRLLATMLQAVGMRADVVPGWSRRTNETWAQLLARSSRANHAWNQVEVDGRVVTVDATWNSGYLEGRRFVARFSHQYFDPEPAELARTHSRSRPDPRPADPDHHYFQLPPEARRELTQAAMQRAVRMPYFRGNRVHVWSHGVTARHDGAVDLGLVMVQRDRDDRAAGCKVFRYRRSSGAWNFQRVEGCPEGGVLPQGGYPAPSGFR